MATEKKEQLIKKFDSLKEITEKLQKQYEKDFIGIVILGSTSKGYSEKDSDIDYALITTKNNIENKFFFDSFKKLSEEHSLKLDNDYAKSENDNFYLNPQVLFEGLFFGNYKKFHELQKTIFQKINEIEWDKIRKKILEREKLSQKAKERHFLGYKQEEIEKMDQIISLRRMPPSYNEMRKKFGLD